MLRPSQTLRTSQIVEVNLFAVISIIPDYAEATGGTKIQVYGEGLSFYNATRCRFGAAAPSDARFIAVDHVECIAPPAQTGGDETCAGQALEIDLLGIRGLFPALRLSLWVSSEPFFSNRKLFSNFSNKIFIGKVGNKLIGKMFFIGKDCAGQAREIDLLGIVGPFSALGYPAVAGSYRAVVGGYRAVVGGYSTLIGGY